MLRSEDHDQASLADSLPATTIVVELRPVEVAEALSSNSNREVAARVVATTVTLLEETSRATVETKVAVPREVEARLKQHKV